MEELSRLIERIIDRVNINLREEGFDAGPYIRELIPLPKFSRFYGFYGVTTHHPITFHFSRSSLAGSHFLGKCIVDHSVLYKSDIRGDELKRSGEIVKCRNVQVPLYDDEVIRIKDSFLVKNLVHSNSHDPECPEEFLIQNTVSMHYANIHGSRVEGSFLGPFSTVDLTTVHDCVIGTWAYVQTGELDHQVVKDGRIWVHAPGVFDFQYGFDPAVLKRYVHFETGSKPTGLVVDFLRERKGEFKAIFDKVDSMPPVEEPPGASISRYAVVKGNTRLDENVLVAQRAYIEDSWLGRGSNAQENCYIVGSHLEGNDVTAHGGKIVSARLGEKVFVGFNSFLHGKPDAMLTIGGGCIVMPHTIVDIDEPLDIPAGHLVWGCIRGRGDLDTHCMALKELAGVDGEIHRGAMTFKGSGAGFVKGFQHRIEHILEANGAFYKDGAHAGHAQNNHNISFNIIQPYPEGPMKGLFPTIDIRP